MSKSITKEVSNALNDFSELIKKMNSSERQSIINLILGSFVYKKEDVVSKRDLIKIDTGNFKNSKTKKLKNLWISWKKLSNLSFDVILTGSGVSCADIFFVVLFTLYFWKRVHENIEEPLSTDEATILYAFWKHNNGRYSLPEEECFEMTNIERPNLGFEKLDINKFNESISNLISMRCIDLEDGNILLCETMLVNYH
ncbi:MAG: hypothetical protein PHW04_10430 [Candidatus Wallbacteria bacterium]|nr:hypothetical protein [Candidatus Wallbacteria bacterium]